MKRDDLIAPLPACAAEVFPALAQQIHGHRLVYLDGAASKLVPQPVIDAVFCLEKMAAVVGVSNPAVYAQMRGETLEAFQKTRNVSLQYSVAGGDAARKLASKND
jgi:selenocysteine lyase/cysteine desulfurase